MKIEKLGRDGETVLLQKCGICSLCIIIVIKLYEQTKTTVLLVFCDFIQRKKHLNVFHFTPTDPCKCHSGPLKGHESTNVREISFQLGEMGT